MVDRLNFGKLSDVIDLPDLIEIQTKSYRDFLQMDVPPQKRADIGLQAKETIPVAWDEIIDRVLERYQFLIDEHHKLL